MKLLKFLFVLFLICNVQSCKKKGSNFNRYNNTTESDSVEDKEAYPDDTYCADVDYYNPDTGFRNSYTLNVDVENNEVVKISFSSGWLDSSEFSSEELESDGTCSITCYDGEQFYIEITGSECSFDDGYKIENDIQKEIDDITCPRCGSSKDEYDTYCNDCKDLIENTCYRCGDLEYDVYGGLCNNCKEDDEKEDEDEW
jgi:hypothetical protein